MLHPASARLNGGRANTLSTRPISTRKDTPSAHPNSTRLRAASNVRQRQPTPSTATVARPNQTLLFMT